MKAFQVGLAVFYLFVVVKGSALAADDPGIYADDKTFSEIFDANRKASETKLADARLPFEVEFAFNSASVSESALINNYYQLDLAKADVRLSTFRLYASYEVWKKGHFSISPGLGLGYGFQEDFFEAQAIGGGSYRDAVRLKWAPLLAGAKIGYRLPWWPPGMVFARAGLKYEWFSVAGSLDGLTQSYWNLGYNLGLGLNAFESDPTNLDSWFGGIFVSFGISGPLAKEYRGVKTSFFEAGLRFLL